MLWLQLVVSAVGLLMAIFTPLGLQVLKRLSVPALSSSKEFFDTMFILPAPTRSVYLIEPTPARTSPLVFPSQRAMGHIPKQALVSVESVVLTALLLSLVFGFSLVIYIGYACATKDQYDLVPASPIYNLPAPLPTVPLAAADIMAHEPLEAGIEGVVGPEQTGAEPDAEIAQDVGQPDVETAQDIPVEAATELDIEPAQDAAAELVAAIADAALAEVEQVPQAVAELDGRPTQAATRTRATSRTRTLEPRARPSGSAAPRAAAATTPFSPAPAAVAPPDPPLRPHVPANHLRTQRSPCTHLHRASPVHFQRRPADAHVCRAAARVPLRAGPAGALGGSAAADAGGAVRPVRRAPANSPASLPRRRNCVPFGDSVLQRNSTAEIGSLPKFLISFVPFISSHSIYYYCTVLFFFSSRYLAFRLALVLSHRYLPFTFSADRREG